MALAAEVLEMRLLLLATSATAITLLGCSEARRAGTGTAWEEVAAPGGHSLPDFVPAGSAAMHASSGDRVERTTAGGTWTSEAEALGLPRGYAYPASRGGDLHWLDGGSLHTYSITARTARRTTITGLPASSDAQTTADDAGNLYTLAQDGTIVQYDPATAALHVFSGPADLPADGDEPRLAWDSKTAKLYLGDHFSTPFYSFDPKTGTLTGLPPFPNPNGMNDAFCSDRHGRIYTSDDCGTDGAMYAYDTRTGQWETIPNLPFEIGCGGSCTVTGDGYLYVHGEGRMARIKVF